MQLQQRGAHAGDNLSSFWSNTLLQYLREEEIHSMLNFDYMSEQPYSAVLKKSQIRR